MRKTKLMLLVLAATVWIWAGDAHATTITLNGNTLLSDTYEGDTVGMAAVADVGTWSFAGAFWWGPDRPDGVVTNAASPGPASGSQYASLGETINQQLSVDLTLAVGDVLKFDSMVYIPAATSALDYPWQLILFGGTNDVANRLFDFWRHADGSWGTWTTNFTGPTSYSADTWQHWVLDYTVGAANATLTIDGVSASVPANSTELADSAGMLSIITSATPNPIYWDDVPSTTAVPGDFDSDGDVDGADFVAWQTHFPTPSGATLADGDADGDGDVDGADFVIWQTNFPFTPGPGIASVPEPYAFILAAMSALIVAAGKCWQR